jgi:transcriptional regulator with XRE-family HTH domain
MSRIKGLLDKYFEERKNNPEFLATLAVEKILYDILKRMDEKNMSKAELARKLGLTPARISQILNNANKNNPTMETLVKLANAVGMDSLEIHFNFQPEINELDDIEETWATECQQWMHSYSNTLEEQAA